MDQHLKGLQNFKLDLLSYFMFNMQIVYTLTGNLIKQQRQVTFFRELIHINSLIQYSLLTMDFKTLTSLSESTPIHDFPKEGHCLFHKSLTLFSQIKKSLKQSQQVKYSTMLRFHLHCSLI